MAELSVALLPRMLKQQLVDACTERGLDASGKKEDLVARLKEYLEANEVGEVEEEQEGEAEAEEEAVEGEDAELPAEAGEGAEAAEANDGAEDPAENGETERLLSEVEKKLVNRAKRFNVEAPTSVEVKLKARALRFGTSSLEDVAKEMKGPGAKGKATGDVSEEELARIKARAEKFGKTTSTVLASAEKRKQQEELAAAMQDRAKRFKEQGAAPSAALEQRARRFKKSQLAS